jgi:hypothetical protein
MLAVVSLNSERDFIERKKITGRKKGWGILHRKTSNQIAEEQRNKQMSYLCFFSFDAVSQYLPMILIIEWKPHILIIHMDFF